MPLMAYCPVGQGGRLLRDRVLADIAGRHDATPARVALAWLIHQPGVIAIPKAVDPLHIRDNAAALQLRLTPEDLEALDAAFPPPSRKRHLAVV